MMTGKLLRLRTCSWLAVVLAGSPSLLLGQSARRAVAAKPAGAYRIAGTVVNTKTSQPLGRVAVAVTDTKNSRNSQSMVTAADGRFQFQVAAGKYSLQGTKRGFLTYAYEQHENFWTGIVTGAGLDTENLVLRLPPTAMISGKVTDEVGEPVRRATVAVYREDHSAGFSRIGTAATVATDDLGTYEVGSLGAGTYFVSAAAQPWYAAYPFASQGNGLVSLIDRDLDVAYSSNYYKEATEADEATPIPLRPADQVEVDFHLNPVAALRLVLHGASDAPGADPLLVKTGFEGAEVPADGRVCQQTSPGVYEIVGLAPGKYSVQTSNSSSGTIEGSTEVNLANNGQEVDLSAAGAGATVKLTVQLRGAADLPPRLYLGLRDGKGSVGSLSQVGDKGEVVFSSVAAGTYQLVAGSARKSYSVARLVMDENETAGHSLTVAAGASLQGTVVLVGGVATVEGVVQRGGKAAAAAMVVLVPDDPEANLDLFRRDQSDFDGTFALAQVVPGTYTILAIENGWDLDWAKPAVIESYRRKGQKIVVPEGAKGSVRVSGAVEVQGKL